MKKILFKKGTVKHAFKKTPYTQGKSKAVFEEIVNHDIENALKEFAKCDMEQIHENKLLIGLVIGFKYATHTEDCTIHSKYGPLERRKYRKKLSYAMCCFNGPERKKVEKNLKKLLKKYNKIGLENILGVKELGLEEESSDAKNSRKEAIQKKRQAQLETTGAKETWELIKQQFGDDYTATDFREIYMKIDGFPDFAGHGTLITCVQQLLMQSTTVFKLYKKGRFGKPSNSDNTAVENALKDIRPVAANAKQIVKSQMPPDVSTEFNQYTDDIVNKAENELYRLASNKTDKSSIYPKS